MSAHLQNLCTRFVDSDMIVSLGEWLNHLLLLNINREKADQLDIDAIGDEFVRGSEHRLRQFGKFT